MFGLADRTKTEHRQLIDNAHIDEVIESKIKECQMENERCMVSVSSRLRKKYGDEPVDRILQILSARRYRVNKYQKKGANQAINLLEQLTNKKVNQETFSL